jgi:hypothetical protein
VGRELQFGGVAPPCLFEGDGGNFIRQPAQALHALFWGGAMGAQLRVLQTRSRSFRSWAAIRPVRRRLYPLSVVARTSPQARRLVLELGTRRPRPGAWWVGGWALHSERL